MTFQLEEFEHPPALPPLELLHRVSAPLLVCSVRPLPVVMLAVDSTSSPAPAAWVLIRVSPRLTAPVAHTSKLPAEALRLPPAVPSSTP